MEFITGEAAGMVWDFLDKNGVSSFSAIQKSTNLKQRQADRAIGWLDREGKLEFSKDKNAEMISLK
jgi:Winged helix-turn-helix domain (DUF2582)